MAASRSVTSISMARSPIWIAIWVYIWSWRGVIGRSGNLRSKCMLRMPLGKLKRDSQNSAGAAQCRLLFQSVEWCIDWWGGPLGPAQRAPRRSRPAARSKNQEAGQGAGDPKGHPQGRPPHKNEYAVLLILQVPLKHAHFDSPAGQTFPSS